MRQAISQGQRQTGFTLVELTVVLLILGGVTAGMALLAKQAILNKSRQSVSFELDSLRTQLLDFARRNHRLPCPDSDNNGSEDCSSTTGTGLPWGTLLMSQPPVASPGGQIRYRVNTNLMTSSNVDIPAWRFSTLEADDFCLQITTAMSLALTLDQPALVERGASCSLANSVDNPAFILADSGAADADGNGNLFDGVNSGGICFAAPSEPHTDSYDDTVVTLGMAQLAGAVCP